MTKEELNCVRELKKKICGFEKNLRALRVASTHLVPILDGLPHSKFARSSVETIALKITENESAIGELCGVLPTLKAELADKIVREVNDPFEQTFLVLRYVECCPFREIAHRMKYSMRALFKIHERILKSCTSGHIDA